LPQLFQTKDHLENLKKSSKYFI